VTTHFHAIVWMDHREARIVAFNRDAAETHVVTPDATAHHAHHEHHKANVAGAGHKGVDRRYFDHLVAALGGYGAILLTGPAHAKLEFHNYVVEHAPELAARISAVEALDHPSAGQLLAHGRHFFRADDRMRAPPA
jgi:stalled ribosome rescue protein Dom34